MGEFFKLDTICAVTDVNRLGQSRATQLGHDLEQLASRWRAFGWHAIILDGHDVEALLAAYAEARATKGQPTMILARTLKGKGLSIAENKDGWHGKALKKGEELDKALAELEGQMIKNAGERGPIPAPAKKGSVPDLNPKAPGEMPPPAYKLGDLVATREAYGTALAKLGALDPRVVALDADVGNSTFSDRFEKQFPDRFYQAFIAEQGMLGAAMGLASRGAIAFPSTFACFLSRAYDFARMANISMLNVKMAGSHAGVSIGEDGPSQMALEDLAMMRAIGGCAVLYPSDAVSTERLLALMAYHHGPAYMRTSRPKTPVIYDAATTFTIGGSQTLRASAADTVTLVGAGITLFEALAAHEMLKAQGVTARVIDLYCLQPIDTQTLQKAAKETGLIITVEDHYPAGGLGEAVMSAVAPVGGKVHQIAVRTLPRSGRPEELIDKFGLSARHIVEAVKALL
jgi:transketolase